MKRSAFVLSLALVLALSGLAMANGPLGGVEPMGLGSGINWCKWFPSWCHGGGGGGGNGGDPGPGSDDPSLSDIAKADGSSWAETDTARAFAGGGAEGSCNQKCHDNEITIGVSVAQWIEYSLSATRIDFQVLKPGQYSAPFMDITVNSNSDVDLKIWAANPTYQTDPGASPEIPVKLALAADSSARPAPGDAAWFSAQDASAPKVERLGFDEVSASGGAQRHLFASIDVSAQHKASEYSGAGGVLVCITNQKDWVDDGGQFKNGA